MTASLVTYLGMNLLAIFVLFPSHILKRLADPTAGLISSTLVVNATILAIMIGLLKFSGDFSPDDLGLRWADLSVALGVTCLLWLGVNLLQVALAFARQAPVALNSDLLRLGGLRALGKLIGQLLGNALFEEVMFRGFLFRQAYIRFQSVNLNVTWRVVCAAGISQVIFAAIHLPLRLSSGMALRHLPLELALLFALGFLLCLVYWRTDNLFLCVGIHALSNAPLLLVREQVDLSASGAIAAAASFLIIALWPYSSSWPNQSMQPTANRSCV
jgi:CAAX protease family protein